MKKLNRIEDGHEVFKYIGCAFDVTLAKELTKAKQADTVNMENFRKVIFPNRKSEDGKTTHVCLTHVDEEKVQHVDTSTPIIIAMIKADADVEASPVVIDGNHRLYKLFYIENENEISAHILSPEETLSIMVGPMAQIVEKALKNKRKKA